MIRKPSVVIWTFGLVSLVTLGCSAPPQGSQEPQEEAEAQAQEAPAPEAASEASHPKPAATRPKAEEVQRPSESQPAREESKPAAVPAAPRIVEVEVPAGTVLELELLTALDSSVNRAGDEIQARTLSPLYVDGELVLGSGALVEGKVTEAKASGRVKGKAQLGFTFDRLKTSSGIEKIATSYVAREAESGTKKDAVVIGGAAGVGAIVGGIIGGKKGAAIGATVGGAGGTGVVLSTKGEEIHLPTGTEVNVRLDQPVTIRVN